jgi:hypothetical protein
MARARKIRRAPDPLETEIQAAVYEHWQKLGRPMTLVACVPNANAHGQPGLTPGLPDLLVMGPDIPGPFPFAFMELKRRRPSLRSKRTPSPTEAAQTDFAMRCARLGILCPTVYGRDEPIRYLEKWNIVLRQVYAEAPQAQASL